MDRENERYNEIMQKYYEENPQFNGECDPYQNILAEKAAKWDAMHDNYDDFIG